MRIPACKARLACRSAAFGLCAAVAITASLTAATKQRPIKKLSYDPKAPTVELFDGIEQGSLDAKLIPKDSLSGNVFIENKTDKPLTVRFPKAVAAAQVLKQGFGGGGGGGGGRGGAGGGGQGGGGMGGGQQMGGGMGGGGMMGGMGGGGMGGGGMGMGGGMMGGMGGGFFSIPPESTVQIPLTTVCLNHGKAEPMPKMTYKLIKLEDFTSDPVLQEMLIAVGSGKLDDNKPAAQAATWHLTDKMGWDKLAEKKIEHVGTDDEPYFNDAELAAARQVLAQAQSAARKRETNKEESAPAKNRIPEKKS
jgi:hypothetical protein